ncbi:MAG: protein kinase, partial [Lentisphaeraceae bacterium]|nr:protein kinase [Lentisphaeraceae bacterium]
MLKAVQCGGCGHAMTVEKLSHEQQVACPSCKTLITIPAGGIDKNTIIGDRYQVKQVVSENAISVLYLATDLEISDYVIIRVFSWLFSDSVSSPDDFVQMISSASHLAEPAHVRIIDYGVDDNLIYTVWSYEDLESVEAIVKRNGPLSSAMAVAICKDLALSLDKAFHTAGVGHYNLSPSCLYLNTQGVVKYSDFGISAQVSNDPKFMQANVPYWNMSFLSPEMALGWSYPDIKSDMYALATVLYFMVTGQEPHGGAKSSNEINYDNLSFPPSLEATLDRQFLDLFYSMTARNPAQRYLSWSAAVSKMDQYLYEEKMKKSSYSQRHRASLTKTFDYDAFGPVDSAPNPPPSRKKRKSGAGPRGGNISQKRMSAEDVRRKLGHHDDGAGPMTFAKNGGRPPSGMSTRGSGIRKKGSGASKKFSATTNNMPVQRRTQKQEVVEEPRSKLSIFMVFLGIVFGVGIIYFVMVAALGSDKKPILRQQAAEEDKKVSNQDWKDKLPELEKPVAKPEPAPEAVQEAEVNDTAKPDVVAPVVEKKVELTQNDKVKRINELLRILGQSVPDRESDPIEVDKNLQEGLKLAENEPKALAKFKSLDSDFEPRRQLAIRMAVSDITQTVRNHHLQRKFDDAIKAINDYDGPYKAEIQTDLDKLLESTVKKQAQPGANIPPARKAEGATDEKMAEEVPAAGDKVTPQEIADKIAKGLSDVALALIPRVEDETGELNLAALKTILDKASQQALLKSLTKAYEDELEKAVTIRAKGRTLAGTLVHVDDEVDSLRMSVVVNEREIFRVVAIKDILVNDNVLRIKGANASESALLRAIMLRRAGQVTESIKQLTPYDGPLKAEIVKALKEEMNREGAKAVKPVLDIVGLPSITEANFKASLEGMKTSPDNAWLAKYKLAEFAKSYGGTNFYTENQGKLVSLSKVLSQLTNKLPKPTVVVSDDGRTGTKTLETALREAKSGEIIRVLPGTYEGTFEIRQKSVQLLGCSGVTLKSPLRISEKGASVSSLYLTAGSIDIQSEVSGTTITNCMFAKDGIKLVGDNSNTKINNCLLFGLTIGSNKRTVIRNTTIVDNKLDKNKDRQFAVKGFISGEINNCVIFGDANYALSFRSGDKESTNYKNCLLYGGNSVAYHTNTQERITTEKEFKKGVGRLTNVIFDRP